MAWWWKALLTTGVVLLVMAVAQRCGRRVAGVLAALPTITGPTLAWTAVEQGPAFAVEAAIGSVAACAVLAMFALAYVHASRRCGVAGSLLCGVLAAAGVLLPAHAASHALPSALLLALAGATVAWHLLPGHRPQPARGLPASRPSLPAAAAVGGLTALAATLGPALGAFATGLIASLPLLSGAVAAAEHAAAGHHASTEFLRGYVRGLFAKAAFGAAFALAASATGVVPALGLALGLAVLMGLPRDRLRFPAG